MCANDGAYKSSRGYFGQYVGDQKYCGTIFDFVKKFMWTLQIVINQLTLCRGFQTSAENVCTIAKNIYKNYLKAGSFWRLSTFKTSGAAVLPFDNIHRLKWFLGAFLFPNPRTRTGYCYTPGAAIFMTIPEASTRWFGSRFNGKRRRFMYLIWVSPLKIMIGSPNKIRLAG